MICPLYRGRDKTSIGHCVGKDCMLTDKGGQCLVKQALQCYVEKTHLENEEKKTFIKRYVCESYPNDTIQPKATIPPTEVHFGPPRLDGSYIFSKGV